jgi:hypothetical protein
MGIWLAWAEGTVSAGVFAVVTEVAAVIKGGFNRVADVEG